MCLCVLYICMHFGEVHRGTYAGLCTSDHRSTTRWMYNGRMVDGAEDDDGEDDDDDDGDDDGDDDDINDSDDDEVMVTLTMVVEKMERCLC